MYDNLKERLTDMSVLASTRTPADALQYIEELEAKLEKALEALATILCNCVGDAERCGSKAAIAELTGGKDE